MGALNALLIIALIESSRYRGWNLAFGLAFAYYGAVTFIMQIETWYFLTAITVSEELLPRLFIMGLPVPLFFIPLATLLLGKSKSDSEMAVPLEPVNPLKEWVYKPVLIAAAYVVLYWIAGYYIAWQNPELRAFYGSPGARAVSLSGAAGSTVGPFCPAGNIRFQVGKIFNSPAGGVFLQCSPKHRSYPG